MSGPALVMVLAGVVLAGPGCDLVFGVTPGPGRDGGGVHDAAIEIDAGIDGSPSIDTDGDGAFDDVDNCVDLPNPPQHDEDDDGRGDPCDLCPHQLADDGDTDGDGAGDACDPAWCQPGAAVVFDAFDDGTAAPWTLAGDWDFNHPDHVVAPGDTGTLFGPAVGRHGMVELDVDYMFYGNGMANYYLFAVAIDGDGVDASVGITCGVLMSNFGAIQALSVWQHDVLVGSDPIAGQLPTGRYRLQLSVAEPTLPNIVTCTLTPAGVGTAAQVRTTVNGRGPGSRVAIRTESIGANMHSFTAISSDVTPLPCR